MRHDQYDPAHGDDCHYHWHRRNDGTFDSYYHDHEWYGDHFHDYVAPARRGAYFGAGNWSCRRCVGLKRVSCECDWDLPPVPRFADDERA